MRKILVVAIVVMLTIGTVGVAMAKDIPANGKAQSGKSNIGHLYLYEKDAGWVIVDGGAWGKLKHNVSGSSLDVVFNGHGLVAGQSYSLITYVDPWPGAVQVLGTATADSDGNVHIAGSTSPGTQNQLKIWLVEANDLSGSTWLDWSPTDYLLEHNEIQFTQT